MQRQDGVCCKARASTAKHCPTHKHVPTTLSSEPWLLPMAKARKERMSPRPSMMLRQAGLGRGAQQGLRMAFPRQECLAFLRNHQCHVRHIHKHSVRGLRIQQQQSEGAWAQGSDPGPAGLAHDCPHHSLCAASPVKVSTPLISHCGCPISLQSVKVILWSSDLNPILRLLFCFFRF